MSQSKVVFMLALLLALLATSAMARNLKRHARDVNPIDEPLFSLRDLYEIAAQKRLNVHLSRDFHRSMSFLSMSLNEKISEEIEIELFY
jgi:hypothetical protein